MFKFLGKLLVLVLLVGVGVWAVLKYFPGLREKGEAVYDQFGGWTEDARRADPVGFIDHAMDRLNRDLKAMEDSRVELVSLGGDLEERLAETRALQEQAGQLAEEFRTAYRRAADGAGFPVTVTGQRYSEEALRDQVELLLIQRDQYTQLANELDGSQVLVEGRLRQLSMQIPETRAALQTLPAKREIARVDELAGGTRELLDQVNGVMQTNREVLDPSPVRTVEELISFRRTEGAQPAGTSVDADAVTRFLEGGGEG